MGLTFSTVKENVLETIRKIKVIQFGAKEADVVTSYGDDSAPLKDMTAIYSTTSEVGDNVVIGYINTLQISKEGEKRIFSQKKDGSLSIDIHLKTDGTLEIAGDGDYAVRYNELKKSFDQLTAEFNAFVTVFNTHGHVPVVTVPATGLTAPPLVSAIPSTAQILTSKVKEVKLPSL